MENKIRKIIVKHGSEDKTVRELKSLFQREKKRYLFKFCGFVLRKVPYGHLIPVGDVLIHAEQFKHMRIK
jgi:hypothetical protein